MYGDIGGTGTLAVSSGATLILEGAVGSGQVLDFSPDAAVVIADPGAFQGTISGFDSTDMLQIGTATGATFSGGVLAIGPAYVLSGYELGSGVTLQIFASGTASGN